MQIGIVGKPNVGKSTFFNGATLASVEIANYPFTTIEANKGIAYIRTECPHVEFKTDCNPKNSKCIDGIRYVPLEMIDVAGLVPGAHEGKGLGNKFLDDLRRADALIHIIDASGSTDSEGNPCPVGRHDPLVDVTFLENEIDQWFKGILSKNWARISKRGRLEGTKLELLIQEQVTGLGITREQVLHSLHQQRIPGRPENWSDEELLELAVKLRKISKPIILAANKCDIAPPGNLEELTGLEDHTAIPVMAELELALNNATSSGLLRYNRGEGDFEVMDPNKLNEKQRRD